jgi:hypothetical protein
MPIHRPDRRAINTISTMKMARLNPTIHPTMAISHELVGNRVAFHMAIADANNAKAELAPTALVLPAGGAISGDNQKTIGTRAMSANDKPAPTSSALSKPFVWPLLCEAYRYEWPAPGSQLLSAPQFHSRWRPGLWLSPRFDKALLVGGPHGREIPRAVASITKHPVCRR